MNKIQSFFTNHLDPTERMGDLLFGLIMVLTITLGAGLSVAEEREETWDILVAVLGGNLAWGILNGMMYLIDRMGERGRAARIFREVQNAPSEDTALFVIQEEFEEDLEGVTSEHERGRLYRDILTNIKVAEPAKTRINGDDLAGALATFLLVFITAIPAIIPFFFFTNQRFALRVSNGILMSMLFLLGFRWAHETNTNNWVAGLAMLLIGTAMVGIAIALGG